jgi:hypothetical protein
MSTISTSGISPSQVIRSSHLLRIINALDGTVNNDIIISGSLNVIGLTQFNDSVTGSFTGSFSGDGSQLTNIIGEWDGSLSGNASITGSLQVNEKIISPTFVIQPKTDLPTSGVETGTLMMSGSDSYAEPYFYDGNEWKPFKI